MAEQFGFLDAFDEDARAAATAHLPSDIATGIVAYRAILDQFNAAVLGNEPDECDRLREEAWAIAEKLNGGLFGVCADDDSPGNVLARETAAAPDTVPIWGQAGTFVITVAGVRVRLDMDGLLGTGGALSFEAHAVEWDRPFINNTGYRSFLGMRTPPAPGMTPNLWAAAHIAEHIRTELKGKLVAISKEWRDNG